MLLWIVAAAALAAPTEGQCPVGLFQSADGRERVIVIAPRAGIQRYMFVDGRRASFSDQDGPLDCENGQLISRGRSVRWTEVPLRKTVTTFTSHGQQLSGTLLEPAATSARPLVVLVHGSEKFPPMEYSHPYMFAAHDIAVFAYDKRGTGSSEGEYTQNFELLADDAAAAMTEARRIATGRFTRAGYFGGSQGGWVAPLAATRSNAEFVAVGYGLIANPIEEDGEQVLSEMRAKGFGEPDLSQAKQVAEATGRLVTSRFTSGFEQLADVKRLYGAKPWFGEIEGEFTGAVLRETESDLRRIGPALFDNLELIWNYDSRPVIGSLKTPQLWVLAEADREAPHETTLASLQQLRDKGPDLAIYSFPGTDHGMFEFTEAPDGTRTYTRVTEGYFRLVTDWIKGRLTGPYGRARQR